MSSSPIAVQMFLASTSTTLCMTHASHRLLHLDGFRVLAVARLQPVRLSPQTACLSPNTASTLSLALRFTADIVFALLSAISMDLSGQGFSIATPCGVHFAPELVFASLYPQAFLRRHSTSNRARLQPRTCAARRPPHGARCRVGVRSPRTPLLALRFASPSPRCLLTSVTRPCPLASVSPSRTRPDGTLALAIAACPTPPPILSLIRRRGQHGPSAAVSVN